MNTSGASGWRGPSSVLPQGYLPCVISPCAWGPALSWAVQSSPPGPCEGRPRPPAALGVGLPAEDAAGREGQTEAPSCPREQLRQAGSGTLLRGEWGGCVPAFVPGGA